MTDEEIDKVKFWQVIGWWDGIRVDLAIPSVAYATQLTQELWFQAEALALSSTALYQQPEYTAIMDTSLPDGWPSALVAEVDIDDYTSRTLQ